MTNTIPDIIIRDIRKIKEDDTSSREAEIATGDITKYEIHRIGNGLFLNLDTGYEVRISITSLAPIINQMISEKVLDRLEGK